MLRVLTSKTRWVPTDMGTFGAKKLGFGDAPDSLDESVDGMVGLFDVATKASHGGKFWNFHGEKEPW